MKITTGFLQFYTSYATDNEKLVEKWSNFIYLLGSSINGPYLQETF